MTEKLEFDLIETTRKVRIQSDRNDRKFRLRSNPILKDLPRRHVMERGKRLDSDKNTFKLKKTRERFEGEKDILLRRVNRKTLCSIVQVKIAKVHPIGN